MKLRLQPGQHYLAPEARERQGFNLRQLNETFTGPEIEAFLKELEPPKTSVPPASIPANSKGNESWYKFQFLKKLLGF